MDGKKERKIEKKSNKQMNERKKVRDKNELNEWMAKKKDR
jgi:hypothetical protein